MGVELINGIEPARRAGFFFVREHSFSGFRTGNRALVARAVAERSFR